MVANLRFAVILLISSTVFVVTIVLQLPFVRTVLTKVGGSFGKYTVLAEDGSFISVF